MVSRSSKEFLVRICGYSKPLLKGKFLLFTNTVSGGGMLAVGDLIQQVRERRRDPDKIQDWFRTGKYF